MSGQVNLALEGDSGVVRVDQVAVENAPQKKPGPKTFSSEEEQILEVVSLLELTNI